MLSRKTVGILAAVLVLVIVLYWVSSKRYTPVEGGGFVDLMDEPIDAGTVESLKAWLGSVPDSVVELSREGDGWIVASRWGWEAKTDLVTRLLEDLGNLSGEKRASSAEVLADFQADEENGMHLVGFGPGGSELFHLIVGKTALKGGAFVRRHDSNDVFLTSAGLRSSFGVWGDEPKAPDPKRWIQLRVHQAERNDVDRMEIVDGSQTLVLEKVFTTPESDTLEVDRTQWTWKPDGAGEFDKNKVDGILSSLANLYASDVADPEKAEEYGLVSSTRVATLTFQDGSTRSIYFGVTLEEDKKTYFRLGEDGLPALIYQSTVDRIFPKRDELKPQES